MELVFAAVCFLGAALLFVFLARSVRDYRAVSQLRTTRISDARPGQFVDVWGKVVALRTLVSPSRGTECVYFRHRVQVYQRRVGRKDGYDDDRVRTVSDRSEHVDFLVDDNSGRVLVVPEGADFIFDIDHADPDFESVRLQVGPLAYGRRSADGALREEETYVKPGDRVHVIGRLRAHGAPPNPPDAATVTLAMEKPAAPCFIISDRPMPRLKDTLLLRVGLLGFGFAGLIAIGAVLTPSLPERRSELPESTALAGDPALLPSEDPVPAAVMDAGGEAEPATRVEPPPEEPATWTAVVTSVPPGATVYRFPDNEVLGKTPATLMFSTKKKYAVVRLALGTQERTGTVTVSNNSLFVTFSSEVAPSKGPVDAGPPRDEIDWEKFGR